MKSKAVVWTEVNKVDYVEVDVPDPREGELLVEAEVTHISGGTERNWLTGRNSIESMGWSFPFRPGYSFTGRVVQAGSKDSPYQPGDRILGGWSAEGIPMGAHSQHRTVFENSVDRIPDNVSFDAAVLAPLAGVGLIGLHRAQPGVGEAIAVVGLGIVGLIAVLNARLAGGAPVIAFDLDENRRNVAKSLGADIVLDPRDEDAVNEVVKALPHGGPDVVLEMTAQQDPLNFALRIAGMRGRVVQLSSLEGVSHLDVHEGLHMKGISLIGGFVGALPTTDTTPGNWPSAANVRTYLNLMALGRYDTSSLVSHRFPSEEAAKGYQLVIDGAPDLLAVVLDWK